jgi:hypothetical protein
MRLYGALNLAFATLYASFGFLVTPSRSRAFNGALLLVCALLAVAGVGLLAGARWARRAALVACAVLLAFAAVVVLLLVASSAYLHSIYGALGNGLALVTVCVALLVVEAFALLPLFELRFLLRRDRA